MSFIFTILLFFFIFFVIIPIFKLGMMVHRARKQMRSFFNGDTNGSSQQAAEQTDYRSDKKIDPNVGEYVEFEEIATDSQPTDNSNSQSNTRERRNYVNSSQIEDAEWEEIK